MRRVARPDPPPEVLLTKGEREQTQAEVLFLAHLAAVADAKKQNKEVPKKPPFNYAVYKHKDVKRLLVDAFDGKCAYCESFYSSTQPMDVEHYRPKGAVAGEPDHLGYYWLAASWANLLPSCIDCNRKRNQFDVVVDDTVSLGKKDLFPIAGTRARARDDPLTAEDPLLVDPCLMDPDRNFRYDTTLGVMMPRTKSGKRHDQAVASIEVYGLNRSGLVTDRLHVVRMIDHHLLVVEKLADLKDRLVSLGNIPSDVIEIVDDVMSLELRSLFDLAKPDRPYCGMARQILDNLASHLEAPAGGGDLNG